MRDLLDDDVDDCMGKQFLAVIVVGTKSFEIYEGMEGCGWFTKKYGDVIATSVGIFDNLNQIKLNKMLV